jgi:DUF4097 and DUF4098 domain-containing protein YvlB
MESRNRTVWIIVAIVAVVLACCCIVAVVAAGLGFGWFTTTPFQSGGLFASQSARQEQMFSVGSAPSLTVDNFAGSVTVAAGGSGQISVTVTKKAASQSGLDSIQVVMNPSDGGVSIRTTKPGISGNLSVEIEIMAPADAQLDLHTGAGSIDVMGFMNGVKVDTGAGSVTIRDVRGTLNAHTGAGSIDARAAGVALLNTGAGSINYQGAPQGACRFETGTGSIQLTLPANLNATVDLGTGVGDIQLNGFAVQGQVSRHAVKGTIGSGDHAQIYAHTGTGSIDLSRQ